MKPKLIVEQGYDAIADRYARWAPTVVGSPAVRYLERLSALLPSGSDVLELGCGNGEPAARMLAARHSYTGVDVSIEQLRLAGSLVPQADLLHADYTELELPARSYDAVVALYTFGHVPRDELPAVYSKIASWLRPAGYLLATTSARDDPGSVQEDWLGAPMFFAGHDAETNLRLLADAGLDVLEHELVTQDEGEEGLAAFLWVVGRRRVEDLRPRGGPAVGRARAAPPRPRTQGRGVP